jgi:hypothetical protein
MPGHAAEMKIASAAVAGSRTVAYSTRLTGRQEQVTRSVNMKWLISSILIACSFASNTLSREIRPGAFRTPHKRPEKLHVVLLADKKDHGPAGNGLHDYPLWQKRWALLLGGEEASEEKQVNLVGPPDEDTDYRKGMPNVAVSTAWHWPSKEQFQATDVIVTATWSGPMNGSLRSRAIWRAVAAWC